MVPCKGTVGPTFARGTHLAGLAFTCTASSPPADKLLPRLQRLIVSEARRDEDNFGLMGASLSRRLQLHAAPPSASCPWERVRQQNLTVQGLTPTDLKGRGKL